MTVTSALYLREDFGELECSAMACIIAELVHIVGESRGSMRRLQSGVMELRLATGEIFLLGEGDDHARCLTFALAAGLQVSPAGAKPGGHLILNLKARPGVKAIASPGIIAAM